MATATSRLPADPHAALQELTHVIAELVRQTHPEIKLVVTPDSRLDADLGLDSLARIELLHRIEEAFGVRLEEQALAAIETPRELSQALHVAAGLPPPPTWDASRALDREGAQAAPPKPEHVQTLAEMLAWYAERSPRRRHVLFYRSADAIEELDYGGLMQAAREVAAGLIERAIEPQQTVAIMLPTSLEFFHVFFGTLLAGAVPVPIYPPARLSQLEDHLRRQASILASAQARVLVTVREARLLAQFLRAEVPTLGGVVTVPELRDTELAVRLPTLQAQDIAFIQYTSGSTGNPKGVVLTHANLLANIRAWGQAVAMRAEDVAVSWLPLYHDMGLIGAWMGSLYHGTPLVLMSPLDFLARPERWLQAIHRHRGTITAAPNFAFELCLRRVPDAVVDKLDLSSWRLSANGAEPVSADTMERFAERFARTGFRRSALTPVYGLAECTVGLAIPPLERGVIVDRVQRDALLETQRALPAAPEDSTALRYVACGRPLPGHEMRIVGDTGQEAADRVVGRLQFRGPSATQGYYRNAEETRKLFEGSWLNTGDIGYMAGGDLYLTSRAKDVIIRGGRNVYPYELEEAVGNLPGVRKGCVAAVGVADATSGTERLLVLVEKRDLASGGDDELRARVQSLANELLGSPADEIALLPPNSVLKTSSGKIRRAATRDAFVQGLLGRRGRSVRLQFVRMTLQSGYGSVRRAANRAAAWLRAARAWAAFLLLAPLAWATVVLTRDSAHAWKRSARFARVFFRLAGISVEVSGLEHLPSQGAYVLLANHGSYLDGILLTGVLERPHAFIAKREFLDHAVSRWFLSGIGSLYVERFDTARGIEDVQRFTEHARAGSRLAIFPEGTFTRQSGLRPFLMGAFVIATDAGVPVIPVTIGGAREILRDGSWFPAPGPVQIRIGAPIAPRGSGWEAAADLRSRARRAMLAQGNESALDSAVLVDKRRRVPDGA